MTTKQKMVLLKKDFIHIDDLLNAHTKSLTFTNFKGRKSLMLELASY